MSWWRNPWARPRFLWVVTGVYLVWSIVPILIAIRFSFNEGRSRSTGQGWSTRWYWGDPDLSVLHDPDLSHALVQSLKLAALAVAVTVPLGVALAVGLTRWRGRTAQASRFVALAPLVTPEIVMGVALLLVFVNVLTFVKLGTAAQAIGHITFSLSFVLVIVRGRLLSIGPEYEEAAQDLGASPWQSLRLALVVISTVPAVLAGVVLMLRFTGTTVNIQSFMGAIMAIGIAVANSILLVSFAERFRHEGRGVLEAVQEGATSRLRAILMTAFAMVAGMVPMASGLGEGGAQAAPLGRAVIGGLIVSTFATLTILPSIYAILQRRASITSASLNPTDPASRYYDET